MISIDLTIKINNTKVGIRVENIPKGVRQTNYIWKPQWKKIRLWFLEFSYYREILTKYSWG